MKIRQLEEILRSKEGTLVEFKKSVTSSIGKEISAFANTAGGRIFIGIDDNNEVTGCKLTNKLKSNIQDIANNCAPRVAIDISSFKYRGKEVVVIRVPESKDKPVQCSDGFFLREGPNSQKMTREEIFYWAQKTGKIRYENQPRPDFKYFKDFDATVFHELLKRMKVTNDFEQEELLTNLGMGRYEKIFRGEPESFYINNAGILFFGKKRDLYVRQAYVTCVLFKGVDRIKIIDRKDFRDGLVQDYENAFKFLQQHLRLEYVIEGGDPRIEIPEIPYKALKEALLNAIIHRDYFEIGARVMVEIYDDRVEISNPGELLFEKKDFGKKSVARNPIVFDMFNRLGLVEKVGTGIKRIISAVNRQNLTVTFDTGTFFTVSFSRPPGISVIPAPSWHQVGTKSALSKHQVCKILEYCREDRSVTDIMAVFNRKDRSKFKKKFVTPLLEQNFLSMTAPDTPKSPQQKYVITEKGKALLDSLKKK